MTDWIIDGVSYSEQDYHIRKFAEEMFEEFQLLVDTVTEAV